MKMCNLFYCPKCGSKNVAAIYSIPVKVCITMIPPKDRCQSCHYEDNRGYFEISNIQSIRNEKIETILNGIS
jgi:hypothetical protein